MSETGEANDARARWAKRDASPSPHAMEAHMNGKNAVADAPSHFYVYYRIIADTAAARATIGELMADVEARTGVPGRLLARSDDPSTWMEIYEPIGNPGAFARTLATCVRKCAAAALAADGIRTVERFAAIGPYPVRRRAPRA
jgi:hypothetical protein